jgi:hypothetical protein
MPLKVLVIGAYGNFGSIICRHLVAMPDIELTITGRDSRKLAAKLEALNTLSASPCRSWCGDAMGTGFADVLRAFQVDWVIHTAGPFQGQSYAVAQSCIQAGVNYCDLSDCRTFVNGISVLDDAARQVGVTVFSGCSSVPTLSSALIDKYRARFQRIDSIIHGISSSAKMPGLSTVQGVLAYAGKTITQLRNGRVHEVIGWQGLELRRMPYLGWRVLANVDVPDMDIFAQRYGAKTLMFKAGSGLKLGGLANYVFAAANRVGLLRNRERWAARLHRLGSHFERLGDGKSALYIDVHGTGLQGKSLTLTLQLTAFDDKGPEIPSCAAVALVAKVAKGEFPEPGARTCVGFIGSDEYLDTIGEQDKLRLDVRFSGQQD